MTADNPPLPAWRPRLLTVEAMVLLLIARALVNRLQLRRWRALLGSPLDRETRVMGPALPATGSVRLLGAAVERAAWRLGGDFKCLPKAICVHWMLRRRGHDPILVLAALPGGSRGTIDDLHAWTEVAAGVVIGESDQPFVPVALLGAVIQQS